MRRANTPSTATAKERERLREIAQELEAVWREKDKLGMREQALRDEQRRLNAIAYRS